MYTILRVLKDGTVSYLNLVDKEEAKCAYYFSLFFNEREGDFFLALFDGTRILATNKDKKPLRDFFNGGIM